MIEKRHIISVLEKTRKAIKKQDVPELKRLSNQAIHTSSTEQDPDSITLAVIVYSISKVVEKQDILKIKNKTKFLKVIDKDLENSINYLEKNKLNKFGESLEKTRKDLESVSGLKRYIKDVFRKAKINKASKIYEHGVSMEKTSKLLGISLWELADYTGYKGSADISLNITLNVIKRIKIAKEVLS